MPSSLAAGHTIGLLDWVRELVEELQELVALVLLITLDLVQDEVCCVVRE